MYDFVCILLSLTLMCALIKYCLNNVQECIIRFKNSRPILLFFLFELLMNFEIFFNTSDVIEVDYGETMVKLMMHRFPFSVNNVILNLFNECRSP